MNGPLAPLIQSVRRALRDQVLPELQTDHARSQLAGALDILAKLEGMSGWLPAMLDKEQAALRKGLDAVAARAQEAHIALPADSAQGDDALASARQRARDIADWLFDADMAPELRGELDGILRASLREAVLAQRQRIPRADFSSMTASSD